ncbi:MAG: primosomal replication protein PriC [Candidatus Malihini olakiniferum]
MHQKFAEHQNYERHLILMIHDRESEVNRAITLSEKKKL